MLVLLFSKLYGYQQYVSCMIKLNQSNACGVMCIYVYIWHVIVKYVYVHMYIEYTCTLQVTKC